MVKVVDPMHSSDARGGIGDVVYGTWRGIHFVRTKVTPEPKPPGKREAVQAISRTITARWKTITQTQRDRWIAYANAHPLQDWTGSPKRLTGYNWYLRCNFSLRIYYPVWMNDPPIYPAPNFPPDFQISVGVDPYLVDATWSPYPSPFADNTIIEVWRNGPGSTGRNYGIELCQVYGWEYDLAPFWEDSIFVSGRYTYFIRCIHLLTGLKSTWWKFVYDYEAP
jgi:hypothetical protein